MAHATGRSPRIAVTLAVAAANADPALVARKNALYVDAVTRHGATAIALDVTVSESLRAGAFASMDGLLLAGGEDVDPERYGQEPDPRTVIDAARDHLEAAAFAAADSRGLPVLGICRGLQAMNVFAG